MATPQTVSKMTQAMLQAPLIVGIGINLSGYNQEIPLDPPVSADPEHAMMVTQVLAPSVTCLDHYDPFQKTLDAGYPIHYVLQAVVTINPPVAPTAPLPPAPNIPLNVQPTQQNVNLLTQIVKLYTALLSLFKTKQQGIPDEIKVAPEEIQSTLMQKIFAGSHAFWNWLVVSSSDPTQVALTVKGLTSLGITQAVFAMLPLLGLHPSFDLNTLGDQLYTLVYGGLVAVSTVVTVYAAFMKVYRTVTGKNAALSQPIN